MPKHSAGLLLFRWRQGVLEVLLVHPGGPFWEGKDEGAWSIPKGEYPPDEDPLAAAYREFQEETSCTATGEAIPLISLRQPSGKIIFAWALEGDCDAAAIRSNTFSLEWPPCSGRRQEFPEVDRAAWFPLEAARKKIIKGQAGFLEELEEVLQSSGKVAPPPQLRE
jgi:predicted NUDIX family NTP pyrophosphohydrolase